MAGYLFTSESVSEGHPDKVCDAISDAVLDAALAQDKMARVACETMVKTGYAIVAGEITTTATLDIPKLVRFFLDKYGKREGLRDVRITQEALQKVMRYPFPGNVRELENLIEGALALTTDPVIDPGDLLLPEEAVGSGGGTGVLLPGDMPTLDELEARYIARVLAFTKGNLSKAARILGVDRKTLYRKRDELGQLGTLVDNWDIH